jgi:hypothetical protein
MSSTQAANQAAFTQFISELTEQVNDTVDITNKKNLSFEVKKAATNDLMNFLVSFSFHCLFIAFLIVLTEGQRLSFHSRDSG